MLTQDQINQIVARNGGMWTDPETGRLYMAQYSGGSEAAPPELQGFIGSDVATNNGFSVGTPVSHYDLSGAKGMSYNVPEPEPMFSGVGDFLKSIAPVVLAAVGMNYAFPTSGGSLSSLPLDVGGGGSGMDIGATGAEGWGGPDILSKSALDGTNAFGANSIPGAYGMGVEAAAPLSKAALDGTTAFGANSVADAYYLGAPAATGGGWLDKIAGAVGGKDNFKLLGSLGTGLLAAGSPAPQSTRESKMDPRLDPYVYGDKGVIPMASLLYQNRTNPTSQTMTDRAALRARAKGLLGI